MEHTVGTGCESKREAKLLLEYWTGTGGFNISLLIIHITWKDCVCPVPLLDL